MVQFLPINFFFLGFLQFLLGFSKVPVFLCHSVLLLQQLSDSRLDLGNNIPGRDGGYQTDHASILCPTKHRFFIFCLDTTTISVQNIYIYIYIYLYIYTYIILLSSTYYPKNILKWKKCRGSWLRGHLHPQIYSIYQTPIRFYNLKGLSLI